MFNNLVKVKESGIAIAGFVSSIDAANFAEANRGLGLIVETYCGDVLDGPDFYQQAIAANNTNMRCAA
jgi:hypothetical protein